jgi:transcriptional regulator with XRE-family HTH domain
MDLNPMDSVGTRVASLRRRAELSQDEFVHTAQVSAEVLRAVEQGDIPAGASFTAAAATALSVDITVLTGQPYDELVLDPRSDAAAIPALLEVLRHRLDALVGLRSRARYRELSRELPELLRALYVHQEAPPPGERVRELLAGLLDDAYSMAQTACYRFGFLDLTARLDDRRARAAAATGDPLRVAAEAFARTRLPLNRGDYDGCVRRINAALRDISDRIDPAALAVRGQLHLRLAVVAARDGRGPDAEAHLAEARDIAASGVPDHPYPDIDCSPLNVDIHRVSVPVELGDGATAVARAESVHLGDDDRRRCRIGRYHIDLARAWTLCAPPGSWLRSSSATTRRHGRPCTSSPSPSAETSNP